MIMIITSEKPKQPHRTAGIGSLIFIVAGLSLSYGTLSAAGQFSYPSNYFVIWDKHRQRRQTI